MDIVYFILLIIVIGVFFFIDKYTSTQNAMFVVVILSLIGIISIWYVDIEIVEYGKYVLLNGTSNVYVYNTIDITNNDLGIVNAQNFFVLSYIMFFLLGAINILLGKNYEGKNK